LQRYGWHGADDALLQANFDNAVGRYPWLDAVRDRSVTELEFLRGHLNDPGALPACLCFRDKVQLYKFVQGCIIKDQRFFSHQVPLTTPEVEGLK
jgi:hypothetical protein